MLVLPGHFGDVKVSAEVDLGRFRGTVAVAHHIESIDTAGLMEVATRGEVALVELIRGRRTSLDTGRTNLSGAPVVLTVSAAGRHLKGWLYGKQVVHGHVKPRAPGSCGILLDGVGSVRIVSMEIIPLDRHR
mgnify:FL=1